MLDEAQEGNDVYDIATSLALVAISSPGCRCTSRLPMHMIKMRQDLRTGSLTRVLCLQVWDFVTGKLKRDLQFQADEQFMMHDTAVLALGFSRDSELLASASQDGKIKARWSFLTPAPCEFDCCYLRCATSAANFLEQVLLRCGYCSEPAARRRQIVYARSPG